MGSTLFGGLMDTRFPKRRPGFANRRKRASLRPKGVEDFSTLSFLAAEMLRFKGLGPLPRPSQSFMILNV